MNDYKVIIVGDDCVGKSTYMKMLKSNIFDMNYIQTLGVELTSLPLCFCEGKDILFKIWDCNGDDDMYYNNANFAIVMFTSPSSINKHVFRILNKCGNIPIILVKSKCDTQRMLCDNINIPYIPITSWLILQNIFHEDIANIRYICISTKYNYNLLQPFQTIYNIID